jgi:hypothetical protein
MFTWEVVLIGLALPAFGSEPKVDFDRDIRPILSDKCFKCHGPDAQHRKAGLRLDTPEGMFGEAESGGKAVVPGNLEESELYWRITSDDDLDRMPPPKSGKTLKAAEIAQLKAWIEQGAPYQRHWAYRPLARPEPPLVRDAAWVRNPIDRFVLARLEKEGLTPSPEADRAVLLRRVFLDLIGLPPSPAEVDAFLVDSKPDAYERVVDRVLASPHYGERWGRLWLDLARYADTHGFEKDPIRSMWPYRDWVIAALNRDLPFDQFTIEQIAGDMLPNASLSQKIASGFHRNTMINTEGGVDPEEARVATIVDRVGTTATVWLGTTLACAQCHDHKYDPFSQKEFYQFFAFFNNADEPEMEVGPPEAIARRDAIRAQIEVLSKERDTYLATLPEKQKVWEAALTSEARQALKPEIRAILDVPADQRDDDQKKALAQAFRAQDVGLSERETTLQALRAREPKLPTTLVMQERAQPRETHIMIRGNFLTLGAKVDPGVPSILPPLPADQPANRLTLARWLVSPENPLTPRVIVNRIWEQNFGRGLVGTVEDFGSQGEQPAHPELLDWLASEFIRQGWSLKALQRLIVTSSTYRQSSFASPKLRERDPDNRLLARGPRFRVEAETIRDIALAASGLLCRKVGGPSVFPPQPDGIWTMHYSNDRWIDSQGPDRYRRGLYTFWRRTAPYPTFMAFDAPSRETCTVRRPRTNTPLQALTTLNDPAFVEAAQALARRILAEGGPDPEHQAAYALRLCVVRAPRPDEIERIVALFTTERAQFQSDAQAAAALAGAEGESAPSDLAARAAWTVVANVLLNLDETITKE